MINTPNSQTQMPLPAKLGWFVVILLCVFNFIGSLLYFDNPEFRTKFLLLGAIYTGVAWGIYRRSVVIAAIGLLLFVIERCIWWAKWAKEFGHLVDAVFDIIFLAGFLIALFYLYAYKKKTSSRVS